MAGVWEQLDAGRSVDRRREWSGYGDIGRACATRLKAMGMNVLALRRTAPAAAMRLVSKYYGPEGLLEMIAQCDSIVVSAALTAETRGMIGAKEFAAMKPGAVVINVGRGPIIDEAAMIQALTEKRIAGAALDIFATEPLPAGHPFYRLENVLLSPHSTNHTYDWLERAMRFPGAVRPLREGGAAAKRGG